MGAMLAALFLEPGGSLSGLRQNDDKFLDPNLRVEYILNSFYNDLHQRHARERQCLEDQGGSSSMQSRKWNQQDVYLDIEKRTRARAASRRYLERHWGWLSGPHKIGDVALHDLVAVQHYIDLDVEDLSLPESERRNSDTFGGPDGNICEPFLRDATRCSITINGRKFSFPARCARRGCSKDPAEAQRLRQAFIDDLISAMLRSLGRGGEAPARLIRAVTSAMSQSGLASVERACYSSQVIVSGGEQSVQYKLSTRPDKYFDVSMSVQKVCFEQCIICSQFFEDPVTVPCNPKSFVSKACTIRFFAKDSGEVEADVIRLQKEMCLVNVYGSLITGHTLGRETKTWEPVRRPTVGSGDWPITVFDDEEATEGGDEEEGFSEDEEENSLEPKDTITKQWPKGFVYAEDE